MKTFLFPAAAKHWAWLVLLPALALGLANMYWDFRLDWLNFKHTWFGAIYEVDMFSGNMNFTDELAAIGIIAGLFLLSFAAEPVEDEFTTALRLKALSWATWCHYGILVVAIIFVHNLPFYHALVYNMFTLLVLFRLRFTFLLWKHSREAEV